MDFANTVDHRTGDHPQELLIGYGRLLQWGKEAGVITARSAERLRHLASESPQQALTTLRTAIHLRDAIYDIFSALARRRVIPNPALAILNKALRQAAQHSQLVHANRRFALEWIEPESNLGSMLWPVSQAAEELLNGRDIGCVRQCASEDCSWLFLDKTRNHGRRWCAMKSCGNRDKARRYYQRQKTRPAG